MKAKWKKLTALALSAALFAAAFSACGGASKDAGKGGNDTAEETLVMATNANFPPYEFTEGDGYAGIDVEIAEKIAEKLGKKLDIQDVEFGSIIAGVQTGKYDMGMAGMTVTDERKESVNFTDSYATGIQSIIVKEDSDIKSVDDISSKNTIGVQQDTTGDIYASDTEENGGYGEDAVVRFKNGADAVQALLTDKVDCVIIDNEPAKSFVDVNDGLKILDTEYVKEEYAICIAKENEDLLNDINGALSELKEDGTIDEIIEKYIPSEGK